jgi:hypothetical protein
MTPAVGPRLYQNLGNIEAGSGECWSRDTAAPGLSTAFRRPAADGLGRGIGHNATTDRKPPGGPAGIG